MKKTAIANRASDLLKTNTIQRFKNQQIWRNLPVFQIN